ncbi:MAG: leucine-rich repeat domain-containing protein [Bacteroidales bacterium]
MILSFLLLHSIAYGYDFKSQDSNGNYLFFRICKSNTTRTVAVTCNDNNSQQSTHVLGTVIIPESVTYKGLVYKVTEIDENVFSFNNKIKSIIVPKTVINIGIPIAVDCDMFNMIEVAGENPIYASAQGVLIDKKGTRLICYPVGRSGSYTIPSSIKEIDNYAFIGCRSLTSVNMPDSLQSIGNLAFSECTSLKSITIPAGIKYIGWYAFRGCSTLTTVKFNAINCNYMGNYLATVFDDDNAVSVINIGKDVRVIPDYAFYGCSAIAELNIPDKVSKIGASAFFNCSSLEKISLGSNLKTISENAFSECRKIKSICIESTTLPELQGDVFSS